MCEFLDEDGQAIEAGDIIQRWNRNDRQWYDYKVLEVNSKQSIKTVYGPAPGYINQGAQKVTEVSLKAKMAEPDGTYRTYGTASKLKKSQGIRKVT